MLKCSQAAMLTPERIVNFVIYRICTMFSLNNCGFSRLVCADYLPQEGAGGIYRHNFKENDLKLEKVWRST